MNNYYFIIPEAVYYCCIIPALIVIIACVLFSVVYRKKKETKYYAYTLNYVYNIGSILVCVLLFPLLMGYSAAIWYMMKKGLLIGVGALLNFLLIILPLIPLVTLIYVMRRFILNLDLKNKIDERYQEENLSEEGLETNEEN